MMAHLRLTLALAGCALFLSAEDWNMYLRDPAHSSFNAAEVSLAPDNIHQLGQAWTTAVPGYFAAAPSYAGDALYVGDWAGVFRAVDAANGRVLWKRFLGTTAPDDPACSQPLGVTSQAAIDGDTVYVGGGDSFVYALDRATGDVRWRVRIGDPAGGAYIWSSVTLYKGALYIGLASLGDCPLVRGALVRIDPADPQRPKFRYLAPEGEIGGGIWSTPAIDEATNTVYVTTGTGEQDAAAGLFGGAFAALDADTLEIKAYYFLPTNSVEDDIEWGSSPTLFTGAGGEPLVAATGKDGVLYALRRDDMSVAWQTRLAIGCICPQCGCGSISTPAFDGRTLYAGAGVSDPEEFAEGSVYAIDAATGSILWSRMTAGVVVAPVTIANGLLYAATTKGLLVFDAATGDPVWDDGGAGALYSQPVVADGSVFCTYLAGSLVSWRPLEVQAGPDAIRQPAPAGLRR